MTKYRVCWQYKEEGSSIHKGEPTDYETALAWVNKINKQYPNIDHWVEEVTNND